MNGTGVKTINMEKILFVCHGNICRSVMGQWIFQDLIDQTGLQNDFYVDSAAVSREETGSTIYPAAKRKLLEKGIPIGTHFARQITRDDYNEFDHIYVMDDSNLMLIKRIIRSDPKDKIELLLEDEEIDDPWYTGDFETAYRQIEKGCKRRLREIRHEKNI